LFLLKLVDLFHHSLLSFEFASNKNTNNTKIKKCKLQQNKKIKLASYTTLICKTMPQPWWTFAMLVIIFSCLQNHNKIMSHYFLLAKPQLNNDE
jgi:hypothetical protein